MPRARSRRGACWVSIPPDPRVSRARIIRFGLLFAVALGLAPGLVWRTPTGLRDDVAVVRVTPLAAREGVAGRLTLTGAWELSSPHGWFGGFSALAAAGEGRLIAGSDRGWLLDIDIAGEVPRAIPASFRFVGERMSGREEVIDLESLARDSLSGTLWGGFEAENVVFRWAPGGTRTIRQPPEIAQWRQNSGPEAMTRLADGRFVMLAEGPMDDSDTVHEALLFARDPAQVVKAQAFRFRAEADYDPVDMTQLPDGRVLILLRRVEYTLPATFDTAIAIADPRAIRAGKAWQAQVIERMTGGVFADNFEGIAFVPDAADPSRGAIWVIADDNFSVFQKSVLVRFDWGGGAGGLHRASARSESP